MTEAPKLLSLRIVRFAPVKPLERQKINSGFPPALFLRGGRVAAALGVSLLCFTDGMANPAGGSVRHGSATIVQNGDQVTINQSSGIAILDWHSFSIAQGETTKFIQPSSSSVALNRVNGGTQSLINGRLEANGGIVLINPAGIVVGPSGVVNVNSFIASTHDVTDDEFLSGGAMKFQGSSEASIQNLGTIHAESGDIFLIAHSVINEGTLSAKKGTVGLVAANEVLLRPDGDEKLSILSQEATGGKISHSGTIEAVTAEIKAAGNPYAVAINLDGVIQAKGALGKKAKVIVDAGQGDIQVAKTVKIDAGGDSEGGKVIVQSKGNLEIAGTILATSATGNGGEVQLLGDSIHLGSTAVVDASGFAGGGKIFVGGDYQGGNNPDVHYSSTALRNAQTLVVEQGAELMANATGNGNGGVIIQWSDGTTVSSGAVSVKGGPLGGNGSFTEISGKQNLGFNGTVDLAAPNGKAGTVLFDPSMLYIHDVETTADGPLPTSQTLYLSGADNNYWLSTAVINSIANGTVLLQANNVQFSEPGGFNLGNIILQPNVSLQIQATTGDLIMPTGSSITASGGGWVNLIAYNVLNFGGVINSVNGSVTLESYYGNLNLSPGGAIQQSGNGGIRLLVDSGSILGTAALSSVSGWVWFQAPNNQTGMIENQPKGSIDFSGSISAGNWIDVYGGNEITLSGPVTSSGSSINFHAGNGITLDNFNSSTLHTSFNALYDIYLTAPSILLNGTPVTSDRGNIWINTGNRLTLSSDTLASISSTEPGGIFDNLSAQGIYLQANAVSISGQTINLPSGVNLQIQATTGDLIMPTGSSITASGGGWVNLIAYNVLNFGGVINSVNGSVTLESYYGNLNLSPGGAIQQSGNGGIRLLVDSGSILGTAALSSVSGWVWFQAPNNQTGMIENQPKGSIDFSGSISAGNWIDVYGGNEITLSGPVTSSGSSINFHAGNGITLDNFNSSTTISASGNLQLNTPLLTFINTPVLSVGSLSGSFGTINSSSAHVGSAGSVTKVYDRTRAATLSPGDLVINGMNGGYSVNVVSANGNFNSPDVQSANLVIIDSLLLQLSDSRQTINGNFSLVVKNLSLAGQITPAPVTVGLVGSTTKVYDTTRNASVSGANFSDLGGVLGDDRVALTPVSAGLYDTKDAGTGKTVTVNVGLNNANYQLVDSEGRVITSISASIGAIMKMTLTATLTGDVTQQYNGNAVATISPANYILNGTIYGSDAGNLGLNNPITGSYDNANAGSGKKVTVDGLALTGSAANNYQLVSTTIEGNIGTITKAPVSASLIGDLTKQYNGNAAATISPDNYLLNGILGRDAGNVGLNNPVTGSYDNPNPGAGINVTVNGLALTGSAAPNYQLASATINAPIGTITAPPPPLLNTMVTGLMNNSDFMRMASAVMGPAGPAMGGSFGGMGPSGGMGGFSSGASFGGPAPSSAPAPSGPGGGGEMAGGPSGSGGPSPTAGPGGEGAAPPPPGSEGSSGGESGAAPGTPGAPVAGGPGGEAAPAPNGPAPAAPGAPSSSGSSAGTGGSVASGAPGGAGLAGTAASAPHLPASIAAVNTMNNPIPSSVGQAHSLNAFSAAADHGGVESGGSSSAAAGASGPGKSQSSAGGRSGTMGFGSDPETAESVNSTITTLMMVL